MNTVKQQMRAKRSDPVERRKQILKSAIYVAGKIGHLNMTRADVARACRISGALVAKYFSTIRKLQQEVFKEAIRTQNYTVLRHCVAHEKCKMSPELKRKTIAFLLVN